MHLGKWHWPTRNAEVLTNGIDITKFVPSDRIKAEVRREFGIPERSLILGYVGRWHPDKDVGALCRALTILGADIPDLVVIFCGKGLELQNRDFADAVAAASKSLRCISLGEVSDTSQMIPAFDFLCLCSRREAFPLVLCEALSCGVPCVTTDVGDCRSIINGFGRIVQPGDFRQLAQAIVEYAGILRRGSAIDTRMATREWAEKAFDEKIVTQRYLSVLEV